MSLGIVGVSNGFNSLARRGAGVDGAIVTNELAGGVAETFAVDAFASVARRFNTSIDSSKSPRALRMMSLSRSCTGSCIPCSTFGDTDGLATCFVSVGEDAVATDLVGSC